MTRFGHIKNYDSANGSGAISPDSGGDALPFKRSDLQQQGDRPGVNQLYAYETCKLSDGSKCAVNLRRPDPAQIQMEQARAQRG